MGLEEVRPYFRKHMNDLKFHEWTDAFNIANIPSTIISKSYHIETPTGGRRGSYTNLSQEIEQDVVIRVFFKGYKNPTKAVDEAMVAYNSIIHRTLKTQNRLGIGVKNIYLASMNIRPYDASNDNLVLLEITFTCLIEICV